VTRHYHQTLKSCLEATWLNCTTVYVKGPKWSISYKATQWIQSHI